MYIHIVACAIALNKKEEFDSFVFFSTSLRVAQRNIHPILMHETTGFNCVFLVMTLSLV